MSNWQHASPLLLHCHVPSGDVSETHRNTVYDPKKYKGAIPAASAPQVTLGTQRKRRRRARAASESEPSDSEMEAEQETKAVWASMHAGEHHSDSEQEQRPPSYSDSDGESGEGSDSEPPVSTAPYCCPECFSSLRWHNCPVKRVYRGKRRCIEFVQSCTGTRHDLGATTTCNS